MCFVWENWSLYHSTSSHSRHKWSKTCCVHFVCVGSILKK
jgi:hypothetical protein